MGKLLLLGQFKWDSQHYPDLGRSHYEKALQHAGQRFVHQRKNQKQRTRDLGRSDSHPPFFSFTLQMRAKVTWRQLGKQPPRYGFFLNIYQDTRFTTCPQCKNKTRPRKFSLVVNVNPKYTVILDKICRFCYACDLLIVHQDQLEEQLATKFMAINPEAIGNDYQVVGTLERAEWNQGKQDPLSFERMIEYLHDFKEVVTFQRVPVEK